MFSNIRSAFKDYSTISAELRSARTQLKKDAKLCAAAKFTQKKITDFNDQKKIRTDYNNAKSLITRVSAYKNSYPWLGKMVAFLNSLIGNRLLLNKTQFRIGKLEKQSKGVLDLIPQDMKSQKSSSALENEKKLEAEKSSTPADDLELSEEKVEKKVDLFGSIHEMDLSAVKEEVRLIKERKKLQEELINLKLKFIFSDEAQRLKYAKAILKEIQHLNMENRDQILVNFEANTSSLYLFLTQPEEERAELEIFNNSKPQDVAQTLLLDHQKFIEKTKLP